MKSDGERIRNEYELPDIRISEYSFISVLIRISEYSNIRWQLYQRGVAYGFTSKQQQKVEVKETGCWMHVLLRNEPICYSPLLKSNMLLLRLRCKKKGLSFNYSSYNPCKSISSLRRVSASAEIHRGAATRARCFIFKRGKCSICCVVALHDTECFNGTSRNSISRVAAPRCSTIRPQSNFAVGGRQT